MQRKWSVTIWLLVLYSGLSFSVESKGTHLEMGKYYIDQGYDQVSISVLGHAIDILEQACRADDLNPWVHYYMALANYRMVNVRNILDQRDTKINLRYVNRGIKALTRALEINDDFVEAQILLGNLYGRKVGLRPLSALSLVPKMGKALDRAKSDDPNNPRLRLIEAIFDHHTPYKFGGNKDKALEGFLDAARLFETPSTKGVDWGHLDALAWLGMVYLERGEFDKARAALDYALKLNPQSAWVRDYLMPMVNTQARLD